MELCTLSCVDLATLLLLFAPPLLYHDDQSVGARIAIPSRSRSTARITEKHRIG